MQRFLYGRLKKRNLDYRFYINPSNKTGKLYELMTDENIGHQQSLIMLQSINGHIMFGVRDQLKLKDAFGRPRSNFMGYELEAHEGAQDLPFFAALQAQLGNITQEAYDCHAILDKDSSAGKTMREMVIRFGFGMPQPGNPWDEAVLKLHQYPQHNLLLMFDEHGQTLAHALCFDPPAAQAAQPAKRGKRKTAEPSASPQDVAGAYREAARRGRAETSTPTAPPLPPVQSVLDPKDGLGIGGEPQPKAKANRNIAPAGEYAPGIVSNATLSPDEITRVPSPPYAQNRLKENFRDARDHVGFFKSIGNWCRSFLRGKRPDDDYPSNDR